MTNVSKAFKQALGTLKMSDLQFEQDNLTGTRFGKVLQRLKNQPRMTEISRVAGLSAREFFASFASESRPVILTGLIPTRLTNPKVTVRILEASVGAEVIKARYGDYADPRNYIEHRLTKNLTLQAFLKKLQTEDKDQEVNYLAIEELSRDAIKALHLHPPPYYSDSDLRTPRMWLGPKHSIYTLA
jgi:hypothetical protein